MPKEQTPRSFNDVISMLGSQRFDVAPAQEGSRAGLKPTGNRTLQAFQVRKYGCAAEIAPAPDGSVQIIARPGWLLGGEISRLLDRGYQKFLKTSRLEIPATADHLRAIHEFTEELKAITGSMTLYNESLGTTSDLYQYDRVQGRE
jgi:hypothetical protein